MSAGSGYQVKDDLRIQNLGKGNGFSPGYRLLKEKKQYLLHHLVKIENIVFTYNNQMVMLWLSSQPHGLVVGDVITVSGLYRFFKKIRW